MNHYDKLVLQKGPTAFFDEYMAFERTELPEASVLYPKKEIGQGHIAQYHPAPGLFISLPQVTFHKSIALPFEMEQRRMEFCLFDSGRVEITCQGRKPETVGQAVYFYSNHPHRGTICYTPHIPLRGITLMLTEEYIQTHYERPLSSVEFSYKNTLQWKTEDYNAPEVIFILQQIKSRLAAGPLPWLYIKSKVGELVSLVQMNYANRLARKNAALAGLPRGDREAAERARQEIDENSGRTSIAALCRLCTTNESKLRKTFKALYGMPPGEYVVKAKMKKALILLNAEGESIAGVAGALGYANASKFAAAFKKYCGITPRQYRKGTPLGYGHFL